MSQINSLILCLGYIFRILPMQMLAHIRVYLIFINIISRIIFSLFIPCNPSPNIPPINISLLYHNYIYTFLSQFLVLLYLLTWYQSHVVWEVHGSSLGISISHLLILNLFVLHDPVLVCPSSVSMWFVRERGC